MRNFYRKYSGIIDSIGLILCIAICLILASCRTVKYVPVESVRDVYHNTTDTLRDSIYHDVFVERYVKGDTVFITKTEYQYKDKLRLHTDSLIRTDSIQVPYPVEKPLSWWTNFRIENFLPITTTLSSLVLILSAVIYIKLRK